MAAIGTIGAIAPNKESRESRYAAFDGWPPEQRVATAAYLEALPRLIDLERKDTTRVERAIRNDWVRLLPEDSSDEIRATHRRLASSSVGQVVVRRPNSTTPEQRFGVVSRSDVGAPGGTRTHDLQVRNLTLYPLSYGRTRCDQTGLAERGGFEPPEQVTPLSGLANRRTRPLCDLSNSANHSPMRGRS